jgi:hypothetical protein
MTNRASCLIALLVMIGGSASAYAACSAATGYSRLAGKDITALLVGSIACYPTGQPYTNQEVLSNGNITDYKKGPGDPIDPSKMIGTYAIQSGTNGSITYNYSGGSSYTYTVWGAVPVTSGNYDFCVGSTPITVRVALGSSGPC